MTHKLGHDSCFLLHPLFRVYNSKPTFTLKIKVVDISHSFPKHIIILKTKLNTMRYGMFSQPYTMAGILLTQFILNSLIEIYAENKLFKM